ncbi:MAG: hypothetical protein LBO63_07850, partial [Oscillospiraceae bacterium]|nr:hypothetical protein [Oscillospiraceae bacterium]
ALLCACAAGGYFFRFAGKSNQKGATSLEEAIFFLYGNCSGTRKIVLFPATYCCGVRECLSTAARRGEACRGDGYLGKGCNLPRGAVGCQPEGLCCYDCCRALCGNAVRVPQVQRTDHRVPRWSPLCIGLRQVCAQRGCGYPRTRVSRRAKREERRTHPTAPT